MTSQRRLGRHMLVAMTMGWMAVVEPPQIGRAHV